MRYEDTSGSLSSSTTPGAHDDADTLPNGSNGPATGNVITGAGTTTGKAGADIPTDAHVVAVRGASGTDTSADGQSLHVDGRYGALVIDEHGNYKYVADGHAPQNFRDLFQYTIADAKGGQSVADLVISRGGEIQVSENAQQIVPGPDGVVTLPPGVDLSDVHVVGRNLVVTLPDGQQIVIVDGAVFVPQLVVGGVEVPSTNLAALLIDTEPKPAAGNNQSSGGNFADLVPPLDPGAPLGDLIPPTELHFPQPEFEEIGQFIDRDPEAGSATALLDDDNMPGGNPLSNVGDDPGTDPADGFLPGSGGDGELTWALTTGGSPASGFSYAAQGNGDVWVMDGAVHVMTISVDPTTGAYTVDQLVALDHPAGGDENNLIFTINYTVTDEDGDVAVGTLTINVDDDTPTVTVTAGSDANVQLTTDDAQTIGAASDTSTTSANFGGVFSGTVVAFGADGPGAGSSSTYSLNITSSVSGLTSHGAAINLYVVGGVVVGSTAASAGAIDASNTIFTVSTTNTGVVTLTQFAQIDHPVEAGANDAPFNDQSISLTDGLVTLTRSETVVDGDGDQVTGSASVNIGANLHFTDDGPTISRADVSEPTLTVDETNLGANDTKSFAALFNASFGADGPAASGSITYALGITGGSGVNSGLVDTATGQNIVLVLNGGVVEGHVGNAAGALAFTVTVDASGNVTLDQIRAVVHTPDSGPDQPTTLSADNLVTLTGTAHDFDGDTASTVVNIGTNLVFKDDAPTIALSGSQPDLTVDETNLAINATGSVSTAFTSAFGADGAGTLTYALGITGGNGTNSGLVDVATGQNIVLVNNAGVIEGHVGNAAGALAFTVSIDAGGTVTLDQIRAVSHPDTTNPNDSVTLSADNLITVTGTITDKDGDSASAVLNIGQNLHFLDDGPTISLSGTEPSLTVDESNLAVNAGPTSFASAFNSSFGADGAGTVTYALSITGGNGTASGLVDTATGQSIVLVNNGGVIEGHVGNAAGALAFTVSVNASGAVTLDQIRAVVHPNTSNPDDSVTLSADNLITLTATVTDKDGDHQSATLNIGQNLNFEDDGPIANDDTDNVASGATTATGNVITGVDHAPADANATDGVADNPGADGFGAITQIHSNGTGQTDADPAGGFDVTGTYGTLHLDANGDYTYTKAPGSPGNVSETFTYTYTDKDGDPATATLTISITDSSPTADPISVVIDDDDVVGANGNPGTPAVNDDAPSNTSGNLTASGGDGDLDFFFSASQTIPGFTTSIDNSVPGQQTLSIFQGGTLVVTVTLNNETGAYTVVENHAIDHSAGNLENNLTLNVSFFAKDVDGSQSPAQTMAINVDDDTPVVTLATVTEPTLTVDETNLAANAGPTSFAVLFNQSFGADGPAAAGSSTWQLGITGGNGTNSGLIDVATGQAVVLVLNGNVVEGHVGNAAGAIAFTVTVDGSGNVTLDQVRALSHPDTNNPNDSVTLSADNLVTLTHTITDHDGDSASATANIGQNLIFLDDGPSISLSGSENTLTVDETNLAANDTKAFAGAFTSSFGADGAGTVTYALTITGGNGVASGLTDVATGQSIVLVNNAGVIEGHVGNAAGALAFTVTVDASGNVTLDQIRALSHPNPANPNDSVTLSADNLVVLTATVTDKDGDHQSAALNIGQNLNFLDDGPTISLSGTENQLTVDETNLAANDTKAFASAFTSAFGADGAGTVTYALGITGGNGVASGLIDVATGQSIVLVNNAGVIEGHVGNAAGAIAFTVTIDASGNVTLDQVRALQHPNPANPNDSVTLSADNLVTITATVTDKDGDSQSAVLNIGQNLNFLDDGPSIAPSTAVEPTLTVDETNLAINASSAFAASFNSSFGADGAGTVTYALTITGGNGVASGLIDVATGQSIVLVNNAGVIEGHVGNAAGALAFTVSVNAGGTVTLDQIRAVTHPDTNNPNDSVTLAADNLIVLNATVTDKDGDQQSASLNIGQNLNFLDDGPTISLSGSENSLTVDETNLAANDTKAFATAFTSAFGADGAGTVTYALGITGGNGVASGLTDVATGQSIVLVNNAGVIEGHVGNAAGALAFTVTVDASGNVTLDQIRAVVHPNAANPNDSVTLSADNLVTLTATVTDKDGDHQSATLNIGQNLNFLDDGPTISLSGTEASVTVDETNLAINGTGNFSTAFTSAFGADGAGTVTYALGITGGNGVASGLTDVATGQSIVLVNNAGVIEGHVGNAAGALAFTVSVNGSGVVTLDQIRAVTHPDATNPNDSVTLSADNLITLTGTVTDKDGDSQSAVLNIGQNLNFLDDGPSISLSAVTEPTVNVDETNLATNGTAAFAASFTSAFGADGAGTLAYALAITGGNGTASGLIDVATGSSIVLVNNAGVIEGHVGNAAGALAFTVSVDAAGTVTLDQIRALQHPNAANPNDTVTLSADNLITLTATVTDKDGDHQSASLNIGQNLVFADDGPSIGTVQNQQTDNNPATAPAVGTLHFTPGADGPGSTMTITANVTGLKSGGHDLLTVQTGNVLTAYQDTNNDGIHQAGETTVVFTLTVNPSAGTSGQYVFDLVTPLDPTVVDTPIGGSSSFGAGPTEQGQILDNVGSTVHLAVVSGYHTTASFNEATWLSTGNLTSAMIVTAGVNGSTAGWGIDNNNFNGSNELFFWDFGAQALSNPDGAGGYEPPAGVTLPNISTATYDLIGYSSGAGDDITYVVHYTDGTFESGHIPTTDIDDGTWVFTASGGKFIADIQMFTSPTGSGKVDLVSVGVQSSSLDKTPSFTVQLTDKDGDPTATANFTVHIATGLVPFAPAAPVVLDLNGDGVHFLSLAAGVTYDYNGDGVKEATAWASPQDGILVHDANHNGKVDSASEFVFGSGSTTDLEALKAFDTNHDGKLSAADADYGSFAVWQDANSNGVVDAGEMSSLMARGITSISLSSDGVHYTAADGDVSVAGTGTYTRADGSTGSLADAAFLVGGRAETGRTVSGNEASTAVLAAALAAAGLVAQPAAASPDHSSDDSSTTSAGLAPAHNQSLDPVVVDNAGSSHSSQLPAQASVAPHAAANSNSSSHGSDDSAAHGADDGATPQTQAPTELLQGTDAPVHNAVVSETPVTAASVAMPSAQDLGGAGPAHNAVVGAVLADALHGGGGGSLDALINSLPGHGDSALDALASHGGGAVPNADTGGLAAFSMMQMGLMGHGMMMHQDAVPAHA